MTPSVAVVCTTIGDGAFIHDYMKALDGADATLFVIPDRKTPMKLHETAHLYPGIVRCPDPINQAEWTLKLGAADGFFPWDTDHRRNVGYLMAYESGADIIISIDDDNLPQAGWLRDHVNAFATVRIGVATSPSGFFNACMLSRDDNPFLFPRGFPYKHRHNSGYSASPDKVQVALNQGMWKGDPDVDAITRLALSPGFRADNISMALAPGTWAPVNSQNTAIRREVLPAYYFFQSPRFGDIYQGYLAQACAKHLGQTVRFGTPVVRHERNEHDLLDDARLELPDIMALDPWLDWLTNAKPEGSTYAEVYKSLAGLMHEWQQTLDASRRLRWLGMHEEMHGWLQLCERVA